MSRANVVKIDGYEYAIGVELRGWAIVCAIRIPIIRGPLTLLPELRDEDTGDVLDGRFVADRPAIFTRAGQRPTLERDSINHELVHALHLYSGAREFLHGEMRAPSRASAVEETYIRIITPHLPFIEWVQ